MKQYSKMIFIVKTVEKYMSCTISYQVYELSAAEGTKFELWKCCVSKNRYNSYRKLNSILDNSTLQCIMDTKIYTFLCFQVITLVTYILFWPIFYINALVMPRNYYKTGTKKKSAKSKEK
jgi:hypothetical protein